MDTGKVMVLQIKDSFWIINNRGFVCSYRSQHCAKPSMGGFRDPLSSSRAHLKAHWESKTALKGRLGYLWIVYGLCWARKMYLGEHHIAPNFGR